jgi:dihydropteroate synthase
MIKKLILILAVLFISFGNVSAKDEPFALIREKKIRGDWIVLDRGWLYKNYEECQNSLIESMREDTKNGFNVVMKPNEGGFMHTITDDEDKSYCIKLSRD